jgi:predicted O-methyltransferase YrrM
MARNKGTRICMVGRLAGVAAVCMCFSLAAQVQAQVPRAPATGTPAQLDRKVQAFLDAERDKWDALNVSYQDGKILHDLVVQGGHKAILEIGTSTGHSTVWLAWAAAKTGGRVVTIEIDRGRHERALANLRRAGVAAYVDARLADAHDLVKSLPGPWDFVFQDADKTWYLQYFRDLEAKMAPGGCYTAHNVARPYARQVTEFLDYARTRPGVSFRFAQSASGEGISVSCWVR